MFFKNKRGFSLVEIIVVIAIFAGISLYVAQMTTESNKEITRMNVRTDVNFYLDEISGILSRPENCLATFQDENGQLKSNPEYISRKSVKDDALSLQATSQSGIGIEVFRVDSDSFKKFQLQEVFGNSSIKIREYSLEIPVDTNTGGLVSESYESKFIITFDQKKILKGQSETNDTFTRSFKFFTEIVNANGVVYLKTCRSLDDSFSSLWKRAAGTSDIYYNDQNGSVGIGLDNPGDATNGIENESIKLVVNGSAIFYGKVIADSFMHNSDLRLKENIAQIENPLGPIMSIRGVSFDWINSGKHDVGFIAQEVEEYIPEIVSSENEFLTMDYSKLVPFLIEAIKQQQQMIQELKLEVKNVRENE